MALKCTLFDWDITTYSWQFLEPIIATAIAAGWTLYDDVEYATTDITTDAEQSVVLYRDFSGGVYGDEKAYVEIAVYSTTTIKMTLYNDWDLDTHTGSNATTTKTLACRSSSLPGQLLIGADSKFLWIWGYYDTHISGVPLIVSGFNRLTGDTMDLSTTLLKSTRTCMYFSAPGVDRQPSFSVPLLAAQTGSDAILTANLNTTYGSYGPMPDYPSHNHQHILQSFYPMFKEASPTGEPFDRVYNFGLVDGLRGISKYNVDGSIIQRLTIFPSIAAPEWLSVDDFLVVPWVGDNGPH